MNNDQLIELIDVRIYKALAERTYLPTLRPSVPASDPFMAFSTVAASDFLHPRYFALCKLIAMQPTWHRKQWEWVFIVNHLAPFITPGMRGLGFGVGTEMLPAVFASLGANVVATDAPSDQGHWEYGNQWGQNVEALRYPVIIPDALLAERVSFQPCDMTRITEDLTSFDFTWSACALEHLGSLRAGMDFVRESVRRLKPGGMAVHTTEFNLSSEEATVDVGDTVIYRRQDIETLIDELRSEGHQVEDFTISPTAHYLDTIIDVPPFSAYPHLKLQLANYVTTSVGIMIRKGV